MAGVKTEALLENYFGNSTHILLQANAYSARYNLWWETWEIFNYVHMYTNSYDALTSNHKCINFRQRNFCLDTLCVTYCMMQPFGRHQVAHSQLAALLMPQPILALLHFLPPFSTFLYFFENKESKFVRPPFCLCVC
jgi:hypothetical protein